MTVVRTTDLLIIRIRRASTFWPPVTLIAVFGILLPIVCGVVGTGVVFLLHSFRQGQFLSGVSALATACLLIAEPIRLLVQTQWLFPKRTRALTNSDIKTFETRERLLWDSYGGAVRVYELWLIQTSGPQPLLFKTVRISRARMNQLAVAFASFHPSDRAAGGTVEDAGTPLQDQ